MTSSALCRICGRPFDGTTTHPCPWPEQEMRTHVLDWLRHEIGTLAVTPAETARKLKERMGDSWSGRGAPCEPSAQCNTRGVEWCRYPTAMERWRMTWTEAARALHQPAEQLPLFAVAS